MSAVVEKMILLELFFSFLKIGFTSFGGLSMIPLVSDEMLSHGWMTAKEVTDIIVIAESTPGPIGLNCASYAGMKSAGILGAVAANLGVLTPSFTLCIAAAIFFEKAKTSRIMANILVGIRPACIGLMLGVVLSLCLTNYFSNSSVDLWAIFIGLMSLYLVVGKNMDIPHVICISALLGIIIYAPGSIFNALLCCQRQ